MYKTADTALYRRFLLFLFVGSKETKYSAAQFLTILGTEFIGTFGTGEGDV